MPQFYTLLTDTGQAKLANAVALGGTIEITELAIGDGNGNLPAPDSSAVSLVNEVRRAPINASQTDPDNPSWIVVEQVLPPDVGGWTIREIGIYDVDGDLIGIGNYPETYKPVLAEGSSRTQTVRFVLEVSDTGAVTLKVDPRVVLATREYVDAERAEHEASRNHPAATTGAKGMARYSTNAEVDDGSGDDSAVTPDGLRSELVRNGLRSTGGNYSGSLDSLTFTRMFAASGESPEGWDSENGIYPMGIYFHRSSIVRAWLAIGHDGQAAYKISSSTWRVLLHTGNLPYASSQQAITGSRSDLIVHPAALKSAIDASRSSDQFSDYSADRTYATGEIVRGSDGVFYEFYDRDQAGTVSGVAPTDPLNRPHVWMEWHGVRPGTVIEWRSETLPEGYVENDGAEISRADYRRIFTVYGTTHGVGDGSTTFSLPDDRGEFKRGWDHGRGVDSGRVLGAQQAADFAEHRHNLLVKSSAGGSEQTSGLGALAAGSSTLGRNTNAPEDHLVINSGEAGSLDGPVRAAGGPETRPRNNAVIYLTKI